MGKNMSFLTHGVESTVDRCPTSDGAYFLPDWNTGLTSAMCTVSTHWQNCVRVSIAPRINRRRSTVPSQTMPSGRRTSTRAPCRSVAISRAGSTLPPSATSCGSVFAGNQTSRLLGRRGAAVQCPAAFVGRKVGILGVCIAMC